MLLRSDGTLEVSSKKTDLTDEFQQETVYKQLFIKTLSSEQNLDLMQVIFLQLIHGHCSFGPSSDAFIHKCHLNVSIKNKKIWALLI